MSDSMDLLDDDVDPWWDDDPDSDGKEDDEQEVAWPRQGAEVGPAGF
jgi:hypothetical protein